MSDETCDVCDRPIRTPATAKGTDMGDGGCWRLRDEAGESDCETHRVNWRAVVLVTQRMLADVEAKLVESNRERDDAMRATCREVVRWANSGETEHEVCVDFYPTHAARLYPEGRTSDGE
jgi:hypothetical protein